MPLPIHGLGHPPLSMAPILSLVVTLVSLPSSPFICFNHSSPPSCSDSSTTELANRPSSCGKSKPVVFLRRSSVHYCRFGHGAGHDTWSRISVLGAGKEKICSDHALGCHGLLLCRHISVVLLGLFAGILGTRNQRIYWRSQAFCLDQHPRCPEPWVAVDPRAAL